MNEWNVTPKEAVELQKRLRDEVRLVRFEGILKRIGGCDVSMDRFAKEGFGGFVTLSYPDLSLMDHAVAKEAIPFPYIPGLLSFREIPMLLTAWKNLGEKPDLVVVDGVGRAHPRRLGIASHLGLALDIPTIGVSKSVLTGVYEEPEEEPGSYTTLRDPRTDEVIGAALRTKRKAHPVFVSPGHRITLSESIDIVRSCAKKHRIPEPTRLAHETVNAYRRRESARA